MALLPLRLNDKLSAYALCLLGIVMLLMELDPQLTDTPDQETLDFIKPWRILLILLLLCLIGMIVSPFIPLPPQLQVGAVPVPPIIVATPMAN